MSKRQAIVLAAGKGTRMKSDLPKVLCEVAGRPMIHFVLDTLERAGVEETCVVVGYRADLVRAALADRAGVDFVDQTEQQGTGHAVMMCKPWLKNRSGSVLVVAGDSPMLQTDSVRALFDEHDRDQPACILGTLSKEDPSGLGRILRDAEGEFVGIVEDKDATEQQRAIKEVNMSTYLFEAAELNHALGKLNNNNRQREYYLTDAPGILKSEHKDVRALPVLKPCEALSINTFDELALVEAEMRRLGYECGA